MKVEPRRQTRFAWAVILFLFVGSVLNYMDRALLGVVMPQVRKDLSLSNADYGLALNAFLILYMVFYVLGGRLADRLGCRRTFSITLVFWSVACVLHSFAQGLRSLSFFRALLGMGQGGFYPTAIRGAAEWLPPQDRAKAVGLFLCGISVGTLITPPLVAWITVFYGWRAAFAAIGAAGFLLLPPWLFLHGRIRNAYGAPDPEPAFAPEELSQPAGGASVADVFRSRKYWCFLAARSFSDAAWYFYLFWMPAYFQDARGFSLEMAGKLLWIPFFCADIGALGGAWASSALIRRGFSVNSGRKTLLIPSALLCVSGGLAPFVPAPVAALALVSLTLLGHQSWSSNIHTAITEIAPRTGVAVLYGMTGAAGTLMGAIAQPLIGHTVDVAGYTPGFVGAGAVYLAALVLLLAAGRIEPIRRPARAAAAG